ncbi:MAG: two-component system response regulator ArcA [Pseudomonadota bacterium]|jgi:two-component system aerobic respiration control protein ArcA|uniref:Two-component system response regulator ArcA n=3 Tax=Alteromonas TaxID=226 RepID=A0A1E8F9D0_9ALTE|nr:MULTISPECIES: two-component system response regulator ArcA [Alteromonas]MBR9793294.1 two-component system response regulator ArcA [Gammaproteobacteria bacterium]MCP4865712.1 two-component system response regulator ArcA [Alteromonas sp.]MDG6098698.1 two-component system response regulator ArcA [Alteromonas sp. ZYF713]MDY6927844.1 two-component system response regulator ArcA [Pseudomonadota bacterium]MEC9261906.1 two-component system response regulator ArcA [Pseudomonadota bacterium]|tara:strand:+ start:5858 stop:6565 length:708 start_codon:yes stop_codon:yes gene_type:complete
MQTPNILIVEDEVVTRTTLKSLFEAEGYNVFEAENGEQMHDFFENHTINLVIMDINLPGKNGLILAREVRDRKNIGLIFLTGRDNDVDRILGLEIGADDYLTKPFNPRELTIRARNLLSRTTSSTEDDDLPSRVSFNGWTLDGDSRSLIAPSGNEFRLPRSEFRALHLFLSNPGKILTREQLIMEMTGRELRPNDRTVDVTIRRIRKHFESEPNEEELIVTIHGEGYRFCGSVDS